MYRRMIAFGGGTSFPLLAANGTNTAPSYSFSSATGLGLYRRSATEMGYASASLAMNTSGAATIIFYADSTNIRTTATGKIGWSATGDALVGTFDTHLNRLAAGSVALGNGTLNDVSGKLSLGNIVFTAAAATAAAAQVSIGSTTATTVGAAGGASALPATPLGYLIINVAGTAAKIPYYNN